MATGSSSKQDYEMASDFVDKEITEKCLIHKDKNVKYYCETDEKLCCSLCANTNHKKCKDVRYIPLIAKELNKDSDFIWFNNSLKLLDVAAKDLSKVVATSLAKVENEPQQIKQMMKKVRENMNAKLDELERNCLREANSVKKNKMKLLTSVSKTLKSQQTDIKCLKRDTEKLIENGHHSNAYIFMKKEFTTLESLINQIEEASHTHIKQVVFQPKRLDMNSLGQLNVTEVQVGPGIKIPITQKSIANIPVQVQPDIKVPGTQTPKSDNTCHSPSVQIGSSVQFLRWGYGGLRLNEFPQFRGPSRGDFGTVTAIPDDMRTDTVRVRWDRCGYTVDHPIGHIALIIN